MALAPIRGAPPGAPNPDFPIEEPRAKPAEPTAPPVPGDQPPMPPVRRRHTPIEIGDGGIAVTFTVIPELPAIARASMTIRMVADAQQIGSLQMSAVRARAFLTGLRNGGFPIVAKGDESGSLDILFEITDAGLALSVCKPGKQHILHRWVMHRAPDLSAATDELLADLGA